MLQWRSSCCPDLRPFCGWVMHSHGAACLPGRAAPLAFPFLRLRHPPPGRTRGPCPCCCCCGHSRRLPAGRLPGGCKALGVAVAAAGAPSWQECMQRGLPASQQVGCTCMPHPCQSSRPYDFLHHWALRHPLPIPVRLPLACSPLLPHHASHALPPRHYLLPETMPAPTICFPGSLAAAPSPCLPPLHPCIAAHAHTG